MSAIQFIFLFSMLGAAPTPTPLESPTVPPDAKQARMQGLHRLSAAELKQLVHGFLQRGTAGKDTENTRGSGAASQEIFSKPGFRRIDKTNDTYCYAPTATDDEESCFAIFRAADGDRYFGYDVDKGGTPRVWRSF
jgi:hypothetical protein